MNESRALVGRQLLGPAALWQVLHSPGGIARYRYASPAVPEVYAPSLTKIPKLQVARSLRSRMARTKIQGTRTISLLKLWETR
jgi:hypothetical protein